MYFLEVLCLIVSGGLCIYFYLIRCHNHWAKRGVPGPKAKFIMGNLPSIVTQTRHGVYDVEEIYNKWKNNANFVGFFNMMQPQILLLKPELIKMVMVQNFQNFHDNGFAEMFNKDSDPVFTNTIFMLRGDKWKQNRSELAPAFSDNKMKMMLVLIEEVSKRLLAHLEEIVGVSHSPKVLDARDFCTRYSVDVVGNCIFGINGESFNEEKSEMMVFAEEIMNPSTSFIIYFLLVQFFPFLKGILRPRFVKESIEKYLTKLIKDVTKERQENPIQSGDFMSFMEHLQLNRKTAFPEILGHVFTFFVDGYEISSNVMAHTLYQLARNPDVQEQLRKELQHLDSFECFANPTSNHCEYLHRVILESLRINAPLSFITKICTKECNLPLRQGEDILIEKNTCIAIPIYCIQRDAEYFANPDTFDPERFLDGNAKEFQNQGIFLPFGDGPRMCMGWKFAMMQVKVGVATVIKNFHLSVDAKMIEPFELDGKRFTATAKGGYWLQLKHV